MNIHQRINLNYAFSLKNQFDFLYFYKFVNNIKDVLMWIRHFFGYRFKIENAWMYLHCKHSNKTGKLNLFRRNLTLQQKRMKKNLTPNQSMI